MRFLLGSIVLHFAICIPPTVAQEIDFGDYFNYSISVTELNPASDLGFGGFITNSGFSSISLSEAKILTVEGVKYLDVFVNITADPELLLNGNIGCASNPSCSIPFTLEAAYANAGANNIGQATIIPVTSNTAVAQFPILKRGNGPPAPPPTPVSGNFNPALYFETAYIYLYGSINIGNVDAGAYTANITVTLSYD